MQKPIVVVGSINLDLVAQSSRIPHAGETVIGNDFKTFCGGKGANQAVAVAKLGYPVLFVANVGDDAFATQLRRGLQDAGVDTKYVNTVEGPSGVALITTASDGENNIVVIPGANSKLTPAALEKSKDILHQAGFILTQLETPLETVEYLAEFAAANRIPLMLDPAPARKLPDALLPKITWITPNETEARELFDDDLEEGEEGACAAADRLLAFGVGNVLLKLGSRGCVIAQPDRLKKRIPAFSINAVDTTGAGDAFNAGFAVGLMRALPVAQSALFASAVAAVSVTRPGAQASMPDAGEVDRFLADQSIAPQRT
jgi:ribokinase